MRSGGYRGLSSQTIIDALRLLVDQAATPHHAGLGITHLGYCACPNLPDLDLLALPGMPEVLASREIATVYRLLNERGVSQRQIAAATGQSQSEVCEILQGRQVQAYDVLVRICEGLGVPREVMGLGFGAYAVDSPARHRAAG